MAGNFAVVPTDKPDRWKVLWNGEELAIATLIVDSDNTWSWTLEGDTEGRTYPTHEIGHAARRLQRDAA